VVWDIVPGDHEKVLYAPYVETFVATLKRRMSEAEALRPPPTAPTAGWRDIRGGVMWRDMRCHNGTKSFTNPDRSFRFSSPEEPWSYAVEIPIDPIHAEQTAASHLEVQVSCTEGVLAVAVFSKDAQTIAYEYFVRPDSPGAPLRMSLPPARTPFSILVRNGYRPGSAQAMVDKIALCRWEAATCEASVAPAPL